MDFENEKFASNQSGLTSEVKFLLRPERIPSLRSAAQVRFMAQTGIFQRWASSLGGLSRRSFERCNTNAESPRSRTTSAQITISHESLL